MKEQYAAWIESRQTIKIWIKSVQDG